MSVLHCGYCTFCSASLEKLGYCICQGFNPSLIWLPESGMGKYMYSLEKVCKKPWILNPTTLDILKKVIIYFTVVGIIFIELSIEIETWLHYLKGTLSNENVAVPDIKNGNQKLILFFSLSVLWLDKFVQQELKQRLSDSLCETKVFHQAGHWTSGCYSWLPGCPCFLCLSSLIGILSNDDDIWQLGEWQQKQ